LITKENIIEMLDDIDMDVPDHKDLRDTSYTLFNILSNIAFYNHCDKSSRESIISSLTEDNLKEFERELISYSLSSQYISRKYAILYYYAKHCNCDKKTVKEILFSDIIMAMHIDFLEYAEKVMDVVCTPEEKKDMILSFWKNSFEQCKFSFFGESYSISNKLNSYAFENIDISLKQIYTDKEKIKNIEKEIFQKRFDILLSRTEKKYIRMMYKEMIEEIKLNRQSAFVKTGVAVLLKMPEFRKMYIKNKLGVK
jgi:hypothetical protein